VIIGGRGIVGKGMGSVRILLIWSRICVDINWIKGRRRVGKRRTGKHRSVRFILMERLDLYRRTWKSQDKRKERQRIWMGA
jgi:hypothetical protein